MSGYPSIVDVPNPVVKEEVEPRPGGSLIHVTYSNGFTLSISTGDSSCSCPRFGVLLTVEVAVFSRDGAFCQLCEADTVAQLSIQEYELLTDKLHSLPADAEWQALRHYVDGLRTGVKA